MNQSDRYTEELLSAYLDGETTPDETARVKQLLADNPDHRESFEAMQVVRAELKSLGTHRLDSQFSARVLDRINLETDQSSATTEGDANVRLAERRGATTLHVPRSVMITAAVAATVVIVLLVVFQSPENSKHRLTEADLTSPARDDASDRSDSAEIVAERSESTGVDNAGNDSNSGLLATKTRPESNLPAEQIAAQSGSGGADADPVRPEMDSALPGTRTGSVDSPSSLAGPVADPSANKGGGANGAYRGPGGLLLVIDVRLTDLGRENGAFGKALKDNGITFHSSIQANSELERALLASRFMAEDAPSDETNKNSDKDKDREESSGKELVYVIVGSGMIDQLWYTMQDRSDRFAEVSTDAVLKPTELALFRRLNQAAEDRWKEDGNTATTISARAFRLVLSSPWQSAAKSAVNGIKTLMTPKQAQSGTKPPADSSPATRPATPPVMKDWLDENLRAEVLFVVQ